MTSPVKAPHLKTRIFTAIVVVTNVLGNSFLSRGMQSVGELISLSPVPYIRALFNPWVAVGVSLLILWLLSHMAMLSWADLSYVVPVTSIAYALVALVGRFFLHEHVGSGSGGSDGSTYHRAGWREGARMNWVLVAIIVAATTAGEVLQAIGMQRHGEIHDFRPGALGRVVSTLARCRYILAAIFAMAVSFFAFMALISVAELSFAVPVTAASYIFETILAKYLLTERIGWKRWTGVVLVGCGVALISF